MSHYAISCSDPLWAFRHWGNTRCAVSLLFRSTANDMQMVRYRYRQKRTTLYVSFDACVAPFCSWGEGFRRCAGRSLGDIWAGTRPSVTSVSQRRIQRKKVWLSYSCVSTVWEVLPHFARVFAWHAKVTYYTRNCWYCFFHLTTLLMSVNNNNNNPPFCFSSCQ